MTSEPLLLDTHAFIWWATGDRARLGPAFETIRDAEDIVVSDVVLWEIVVKESTRNPMVGTDDAHGWFSEAMSQTRFRALAITVRHIGAVQRLPLHHRDPFDRLLIAQCVMERRTVVSRDATFAEYDVPVRWH